MDYCLGNIREVGLMGAFSSKRVLKILLFHTKYQSPNQILDLSISYTMFTLSPPHLVTFFKLILYRFVTGYCGFIIDHLVITYLFEISHPCCWPSLVFSRSPILYDLNNSSNLSTRTFRFPSLPHPTLYWFYQIAPYFFKICNSVIP